MRTSTCCTQSFGGGGWKQKEASLCTKWKNLCKREGSGGLGFRDLNLFNQVLLAKQSWRILRNPDSLLFKVLRGWYFKYGDFLKAPIGNNSSLTWKSIVWGRDLFREGYMWRVGNGRHIYIDEDPWILRSGSRYPLFVSEALKGRRVSDLLNSNGGWNEEVISKNFFTSNVEDILVIPLGQAEEKDEIVWNLDLKEKFSMRSVYHLATKIQREGEASGSDEENQARWRKIWKLKIIPRVKICLWKIIKNLIPSKLNLINRGMDINPCSMMCRVALESSVHSLWSCKKARNIWSELFPSLMEDANLCREGLDMAMIWDMVSG